MCVCVLASCALSGTCTARHQHTRERVNSGRRAAHNMLVARIQNPAASIEALVWQQRTASQCSSSPRRENVVRCRYRALWIAIEAVGGPRIRQEPTMISRNASVLRVCVLRDQEQVRNSLANNAQRRGFALKESVPLFPFTADAS